MPNMKWKKKYESSECLVSVGMWGWGETGGGDRGRGARERCVLTIRPTLLYAHETVWANTYLLINMSTPFRYMIYRPSIFLWSDLRGDDNEKRIRARAGYTLNVQRWHTFLWVRCPINYLFCFFASSVVLYNDNCWCNNTSLCFITLANAIHFITRCRNVL